eukprot:5901906-Pyramimonas_sp.AAC.1
MLRSGPRVCKARNCPQQNTQGCKAPFPPNAPPPQMAWAAPTFGRNVESALPPAYRGCKRPQDPTSLLDI